MARKRKRRLGHVTRTEEIKAEDAVTKGVRHCRETYKGKKLSICLEGALSVHRGLREVRLIP